jgi:hypothetical protein
MEGADLRCSSRTAPTNALDRLRRKQGTDECLHVRQLTLSRFLASGLQNKSRKSTEISLDEEYVLMNTSAMSITPKAIQDLLDELEASKRSRLRAWSALQRIRVLLSDLSKTEIPPPAQKTFDAEGEILGHALTKSLRIRNEAIKSLCTSVRRFRDATIKEECKSDYPHALFRRFGERWIGRRI